MYVLFKLAYSGGPSLLAPAAQKNMQTKFLTGTQSPKTVIKSKGFDLRVTGPTIEVRDNIIDHLYDCKCFDRQLKMPGYKEWQL